MRHGRAVTKDEAVRLSEPLFLARIDITSVFGLDVVLLLGKGHRLVEFQQTLFEVLADVAPPARLIDRRVAR